MKVDQDKNTHGPDEPTEEEIAAYKADCLKASTDKLADIRAEAEKAIEGLPQALNGFTDTNVAQTRSTLAQVVNLIDHTQYTLSHQNAG